VRFVKAFLEILTPAFKLDHSGTATQDLKQCEPNYSTSTRKYMYCAGTAAHYC